MWFEGRAAHEVSEANNPRPSTWTDRSGPSGRDPSLKGSFCQPRSKAWADGFASFASGSAHAWAGILPTRRQTVIGFRRVEFKGISIVAVSVIGQGCDDVFWHPNKSFFPQSQIQSRSVSGFVMLCHVFWAIWNTTDKR